MPVQPAVGKGGVKGRAMAVALGLGQRAVYIEDQCLYVAHVPTLAGFSVRFQSGFLKAPVRRRFNKGWLNWCVRNSDCYLINASLIVAANAVTQE